jgi:hypothetical protein
VQPPIEPTADVRSIPTMPLDVARLRASGIAQAVNAEAFRAAVLLWCHAWHQVPAGSLPTDDTELRIITGIRDPRDWDRLRNEALHGFIEIEGRLYHPVVCEMAKRAMVELDRIDKKRKRWAADKKKVRTDITKCPDGQTIMSVRTSPNVQTDKRESPYGQSSMSVQTNADVHMDNDKCPYGHPSPLPPASPSPSSFPPTPPLVITPTPSPPKPLTPPRAGEATPSAQKIADPWIALRNQIAIAYDDAGDFPPEMHILDTWKADGLDPDLIWAAIAHRIKADSRPKSLVFFNSWIAKACAEVVERRATARDTAQRPGAQGACSMVAQRPGENVPAKNWPVLVKLWKECGVWPDHIGPPPECSDCMVPADVLKSYGYAKR